MTTDQKDPEWYTGPLTKTHIAELRLKLGKTRGALIGILQVMVNSPKSQVGRLSISVDELKSIIGETQD